MARPKKVIDVELVKRMANIHCTNEEIAHVCKVSTDTIERRFAAVLKEARSQGKMSLKRWQWEAAQKGNTALLIWLGKQHLGQSEKIETKNENKSVDTFKIGWADESDKSDPAKED